MKFTWSKLILEESNTLLEMPYGSKHIKMHINVKKLLMLTIFQEFVDEHGWSSIAEFPKVLVSRCSKCCSSESILLLIICQTISHSTALTFWEMTRPWFSGKLSLRLNKLFHRTYWQLISLCFSTFISLNHNCKGVIGNKYSW